MISLLRPAVFCALAIAPMAFVGCDTKEKVIEINTPGGGVEVERDKVDGDVDVKVHDQ